MTRDSRWTKDTGDRGEDPAVTDAEQYDEERAAHIEEHRPLVNDQPAKGGTGISSDTKPGTDAGGYPEQASDRPARDPEGASADRRAD